MIQRYCLAVWVVLGAAACGNGPIKFAVSSVVHGPGGPLVTQCSGYSEAPGAAWAVGTVVQLPLSVSTKNLKVTATNPAVLVVDAAPDADNLVTLRVVGAGTGGLHATADNYSDGDLSITAAAPASAAMAWQPGYPSMEPSVQFSRLTVGVNSLVSFTSMVLDADSNRLCLPKIPAQANGVTFANDPDELFGVDSPLGIVAPASAGTASVDFDLGSFHGSVPIQIVDGSAITGFSASIMSNTARAGTYVRLRSQAGSDEVLGGPIEVENLTPSVIALSDLDATVTDLVVTDAIENPRPTTSGGGQTAQLRYTVPGTTLPATTLEFIVPN